MRKDLFVCRKAFEEGKNEAEGQNGGDDKEKSAHRGKHHLEPTVIDQRGGILNDIKIAVDNKQANSVMRRNENGLSDARENVEAEVDLVPINRNKGKEGG